MGQNEEIERLKERMEKVEIKVDGLSETSIRQEERYNTILEGLRDNAKDMSKLTDKLETISVKLAVNDSQTQVNNNLLKELTWPKIIAFFIMILTAISMIMEGFKK